LKGLASGKQENKIRKEGKMWSERKKGKHSVSICQASAIVRSNQSRRISRGNRIWSLTRRQV